MNKSFSFKCMIIWMCLSTIVSGYLLYQTHEQIESVNALIPLQVENPVTDMIKKVKESTVGVMVFHEGVHTGSGSGVIYTVDNRKVSIITNQHVIEEAEVVKVIFPNNQIKECSVIGGDQYGDIALLSTTVDFAVAPMTIGDSSLNDVGQTVYAIGSPLGNEYAGTVTQGIISAINRTISVDFNNDGIDDGIMNVIQSDAAINPGNSGGAFVNDSGELIGITSMKYSDESIEGMGFALPINDVISLVKQIQKDGKVSRAYLGVQAISLESFTDQDFLDKGIDAEIQKGIYVKEVVKDSPASLSKICKGDIIVAIDQDSIDSYKTFMSVLYSKKSGDIISLSIYRNHSIMKMYVKLS